MGGIRGYRRSFSRAERGRRTEEIRLVAWFTDGREFWTQCLFTG